MRGLMLVPFVALAVVSALPSNFPPGWNKEATSPPMAWRSWNAYLANINAGIIKGNIDALVSKNEASVENGGLASLWDVGFKSIGIDEGWECCGCGVDHTQHDAQGNPVIDTNKFPDMGSLVKYGHDHNVKMGWYLNGCACGERTEKMINYQGDVRNLAKLGFDSVKLDGCGHQKNMTLYATLMNNTGKTFETENCHWGICSDDDGSSCPTKDWCPFNLFRTSGDIRQTWASWTRNLQTSVPFLDADHPISGPSCWAYPDMLQVGNLPTFEQNRAHFGAWCVMSAPLYLGFDLTNETLRAKMWPIVGNTEAIAVNQQWAGHPGRLVKSWTPATPVIDIFFAVTSSLGSAYPMPQQKGCDTGWEYNDTDMTVLAPTPPSAAVDAKYCLAYLVDHDGTLTVSPCNPSDALQQFDYDSKAHILKAHNASVAGKNQYVQIDPWYTGAVVKMSDSHSTVIFDAKGTLNDGTSLPNDVCINASPTAGGGEALQLWAKKQPGGAMAVFLLNSHQTNTYTVKIELSEVGFEASQVVSVRDIWAKTTKADATGSITTTVPPRDSVFVLLTPKKK